MVGRLTLSNRAKFKFGIAVIFLLRFLATVVSRGFREGYLRCFFVSEFWYMIVSEQDVLLGLLEQRRSVESHDKSISAVSSRWYSVT